MARMRPALTIDTARAVVVQIQRALDHRDYQTANILRERLQHQVLLEARNESSTKFELAGLAELVLSINQMRPRRTHVQAN